jgi:YidC/Oxa1 family membrane protein insertase
MEQKRMIIAVAVSLLILVVFQSLTGKRQAAIRAQSMPRATAGTEEAAVSPAAAVGVPEGKALAENFTEINTRKHRAVFSDIGGGLKSLYLVGDEADGSETLLCNIENPAQRPFALMSDLIPGLERKRFEVKKGNGTLEYTYSEPGWMKISKRYTFHKDFDYIDLQISVRNESKRNINFSYEIVGPSDLKKEDKFMGRQFLRAVTMLDGKLWQLGAVKGVQERRGDIAWTALKGRYYAEAMRPQEPKKAVQAVILRQLPEKNIMTSFGTPKYEIVPGGTTENAYMFYAGPLDDKTLAALGYNLQDLVDYGFFGGLSKVLLVILTVFHSWTKNWGMAIVFLTMLVNLILFPLTFKSFSSMQQMKKVQPHMQKLKELHKDNPQKLNKEMMELYKKYNVNPLGGCLPLLLQMPIFIALYQGLVRFIGLKGSHFLWIKDLSQPDAVPLPFSLPFLGASINILPLLMVGVMIVQQKISQGLTGGAVTDDQASQQKMMMVMMPLLFGFLFYKMPSGLVLYWLTNTMLMTAEQSLISRRLSGGA